MTQEATVRGIGTLTLMAVALAATLAHAEGAEGRRTKGPSTDTRLPGADTVVPMADGGLVSVGGSRLRYLAPGARSWETLHTVSGDNLYRVGVDDSGRLMAAWEKDPHIHYFTAAPRQHLLLPRPTPPNPRIGSFFVDDLEFLPNGREALVFMNGASTGQQRATAAYRIALDGKSAPEQLFYVDNALQVYTSRRGAVYVVPQNPGKECSQRTCMPVSAVVSYELTLDGVRQKTLITSAQVTMDTAWPVRGSNDERLVLMLDLGRGARALLRWSYDDEKADYRPLPKSTDPIEMMIRSWVTPKNEFIELRNPGFWTLEVVRHLPAGGEQVTTLKALQRYDHRPYDMGLRKDGSLWVHWGDHLALITPGKPPRSYNLEPLLERRTEWAGHAVYLEKPEALWVGMEVGAGRTMLRVSFAEIDKRSKPWREKPPVSRAEE
jgi:hypothetical protein